MAFTVFKSPKMEQYWPRTRRGLSLNYSEEVQIALTFARSKFLVWCLIRMENSRNGKNSIWQNTFTAKLLLGMLSLIQNSHAAKFIPSEIILRQNFRSQNHFSLDCSTSGVSRRFPVIHGVIKTHIMSHNIYAHKSEEKTVFFLPKLFFEFNRSESIGPNTPI